MQKDYFEYKLLHVKINFSSTKQRIDSERKWCDREIEAAAKSSDGVVDSEVVGIGGVW